MFFYSYNIPIRNLWDILRQYVFRRLIQQHAEISMQNLFRSVAILRGTMVTATIKIIILIYFYFRRSSLLVAEEMKNLKKIRVIKIRKLMIKVKQLIQMQQQYQQFFSENTPPNSLKQKKL